MSGRSPRCSSSVDQPLSPFRIRGRAVPDVPGEGRVEIAEAGDLDVDVVAARLLGVQAARRRTRTVRHPSRCGATKSFAGLSAT